MNFHCQICNYKTIYIQNYNCRYCNRSYKYNYNLNKHLKNCKTKFNKMEKLENENAKLIEKIDQINQNTLNVKSNINGNNNCNTYIFNDYGD